MRSMAAALSSHGYPLEEARSLIWRGYKGGIDGARAVSRMLNEIPEIGDEDLEWPSGLENRDGGHSD